MALPEQDRGARVEGLSLRGATVTDVSLVGARLHKLDLSEAVVRGSLLRGTRLRGVELVDVEIDGELQGVVVNGVDIGPLVEAELNRRAPERAKMRPDHSDGFREAWAIVAARWATTMARAAALPEAVLHRSVAGSGRSCRPCGTSASPAPPGSSG